MRAIKINPWDQSVTEIEISKEDEGNLAEVIGARMIDVVMIKSRLQMIVDDMGALPPKQGGPDDQRFFQFNHPDYKPTPFGGTTVILGCSREGNTLSTRREDFEFISSMVKWLNIHPVDIGEKEGWVIHPVFGKMKQFERKIIFASGSRPKVKP